MAQRTPATTSSSLRARRIAAGYRSGLRAFHTASSRACSYPGLAGP